MPTRFPDSFDDLVELQCGIIARWQAAAIGLDPSAFKSPLAAGRWCPLHKGVYATFTGDPCREAWLWAAVLTAGPHAVLSHQSAAELDGLAVEPSTLIHVTVPVRQHPVKISGVRVHRSGRIEAARHPSRSPPRTRIDETVLDLVQVAGSYDVAFRTVCQACASRLTTPERLHSSMAGRARMRWRGQLLDVLADFADGLHSMLEIRYVRDVERPHALPRARRQASLVRQKRRIYLDNLLERYGICVELDGQAAHPGAERWRDIRRDNASAADGIITLRYSWADIELRACAVAAQIVAVLRLRGWTGRPRPCGPACPVGRS
jgi:very-short-patch-repair endonuclease